MPFQTGVTFSKAPDNYPPGHFTGFLWDLTILRDFYYMVGGGGANCGWVVSKMVHRSICRLFGIGVYEEHTTASKPANVSTQRVKFYARACYAWCELFRNFK